MMTKDDKSRLAFALACLVLVAAIVGLVLTLMITAAHATQPPPPQYDYAPTGTFMKVERTYNPDKKCRRYGAQPSKGNVVEGCTIRKGGTCVIVLPYSANKGSVLYRHERAHCNGWRH